MHNKTKVTVMPDTLDRVLKTELNSSELQQFKELAAKKDEKCTQANVMKEQCTSGAKGFRIIGVIKNMTDEKGTVTGYVLFNDAKQEHCAYSVPQVKNILEMHKFVNAELENGQIRITDGAENSLIQFDSYMNPAGPMTVYVLSRATETVKANGQSKQQEIITFINNRLEVQKLPANVLIEARLLGKLTIANMKVVGGTTSTAPFLEAKNLSTIPTYEKEVKLERVTSDYAKTFSKQRKKMMEHASFAQRLYNYIKDCVLIQNGVTVHRDCTHLLVSGTSELHRGIKKVGVKGLAAIMEKEVIPLFWQKNPNLDFKDALEEIHTNCYKDGTQVRINTKFFITTSTRYYLNLDLNNPTVCLLYRYLYAFRLVKGFYSTVNTYDILREYNKLDTVSGSPYIIDCYGPLGKVVRTMYDKQGRDYKVASWDITRKILRKFSISYSEDLPRVICTGISSIAHHTVIWPMPFKDLDRAFLLLKDMPEDFEKYKKLLLHICSEAALIDGKSSDEYHYRVQRITVMMTALLCAYMTQNRNRTVYKHIVENIKQLLSLCTEHNFSQLFTNLFSSFISIYLGLEHVKNGDQKYAGTMLNDYTVGAGLYVPYYSPLGERVLVDDMHWQCIFTSLRRQRIVDDFAKRAFTMKAIPKKHKHGMLDVIDKTLRNRYVGFNVDYRMNYNFRHYAKIQTQRKFGPDGREHYTPFTATLSRAGIAQYLGRPYAKKRCYNDPNWLRLVLYKNSYGEMKTHITHELY